jgi:hypothetical protein
MEASRKDGVPVDGIKPYFERIIISEKAETLI